MTLPKRGGATEPQRNTNSHKEATKMKIDKKVKEQIIAVRDTGRTNMFDTNMVQVIANEMGFYELVIFIEEHKKDYVNFIFYGDG